ncbi:unnamed protein product [Heterosigma akashiwo]|mmetsp:Transcript_9612/g.13535  ORF Transcript_9612/g.13535 Transcript_9612/m.13535 type:complete len:347 (+) Transcript_9612:83-1123(+)
MKFSSAAFIAAIALAVAPAKAFVNGRNFLSGFRNSEATTCMALKGIGLDDVVTVDYSVFNNEDGTPFDHTFSQGKQTFVVGSGALFPPLHDEVVGMEVGDKASVVIDPEDAYGKWDEQQSTTVEKQGMALDVGVKVRLWTGQTARVTWANDTHATVDANPDLAGKSFRLDLEVLAVRELKALETATVAGGCFWGMELAFQRVPGVVATKVGYTQGAAEAPTYEEVCSGRTGHTEAVQVLYDPEVVSYKELLEVFFGRHDPTQLNRQGNDQGTQYRGGIYYENDEQYSIAQRMIADLTPQYADPIATELKPAAVFYDAEEYHQQYLEKGGQSAKRGDDGQEKIRCYG